MINEGDRTLVHISPSNLDLDALMATFDDNPDFRDSLRTATVLIIPTDLSPECEDPAFPIGTPDVLRSLTEKLDDHAIVDAAILDEDYIEFEYRSEMLILPVIFIAREHLVSLVVNILGSFIHDLLKNRRSHEPDATVKSEMHYVGANGGIFFLKYEGPADTYERVVLQNINHLDSFPNEGGPLSTNE